MRRRIHVICGGGYMNMKCKDANTYTYVCMYSCTHTHTHADRHTHIHTHYIVGRMGAVSARVKGGGCRLLWRGDTH